MSKKTIATRETQVTTQSGLGRSVEQNLIIDDNIIPSPQELEKYKEVDPRFLDYFFNTAEKEQKHRHEIDKMKMKIIRRADGKVERMNWWGMFFAFFSIVACLSVAAWALYLNRPWFAGIFAFSGLSVIASIFINSGKKTK